MTMPVCTNQRTDCLLCLDEKNVKDLDRTFYPIQNADCIPGLLAKHWFLTPLIKALIHKANIKANPKYGSFKIPIAPKSSKKTFP